MRTVVYGSVCMNRNIGMYLAALLLLWSCAESGNAGQALDTSANGDTMDSASEDLGVGTDPVSVSPLDSAVVDASPADTASVADSGSGPDSVSPPPPNEPLPTWWDCRRALVSGQMTAPLKATCDSMYLEPPVERVYGIRWVFLTDVGDQEQWIAHKLSLLESAFDFTGFRFQTRSVLEIVDPAVVLSQSDNKVPFETVVKDVSAHLDVDETDPAIVLSLLKERMASVGVSAGALETIKPDKLWAPQEFHSTMARLRPEEIHVIVVQKLNETNTAGGLSSGPSSNPTGPRVSVVHIKGGNVEAPAFPHEFGHFFGLKHPHGQREGQEMQVPFSFQDALDKVPFEMDMVVALQDTLTPSLDGPLGELYTPYTIKGAAVKENTERRYAVGQLYLAHGYTYRNGDDGPEAFGSLLDFVTHGASGEPLFYKNFTQKKSDEQGPNNCFWDDVADMIACELGVPTQLYLGTDPMLDGTLVMDQGQTANIMTYMGKVLPLTDDNMMVAFTPEQVQVMKVHANTPVRQTLRNHALSAGSE